MIRRRALSFVGSAAIHLCALGALLALAASLREPQPLFVDLTGGGPAGDERAANAPAQGRETAIAPARQAPRMSARAQRAPAPAPAAQPAEATPAPAPSFSASREAAPADQGAQPSVADADGRDVRGVTSDAPGRVTTRCASHG